MQGMETLVLSAPVPEEKTNSPGACPQHIATLLQCPRSALCHVTQQWQGQGHAQCQHPGGCQVPRLPAEAVRHERKSSISSQVQRGGPQGKRFPVWMVERCLEGHGVWARKDVRKGTRGLCFQKKKKNLG